MTDTKDDSLLSENIKKMTQEFIDMIQKLYDQDINVDDCTVLRFKNFLPMFTVLGTLLAAQLDINQDEYYAIVDYYIKELSLMVEDGTE